MKNLREQRLKRELQVTVWGMDADGKPFTQTARTVDVARHGARLLGIERRLAVGEIIGVRNGPDKARFRVMWVGAPGTPQAGQVGIRCVENEKHIWGAEPVAAPVPASKPETVPPAPPQTPGAYSKPLAGSSPTVKPERPEREQRKFPRFKCNGGAQFRREGTASPSWGTMTDVSMCGCYIETSSPAPVFTRLHLSITTEECKLELRGTVQSSDPGFGMGISFGHLEAEQRERLEKLIATLEKAQASAATL